MIGNLVAFPTDAESSPLFGALATALLPALGIAEDTPFYCAPKGTFCARCGACGEKTALQKHHLQLYHDMLTLTGVAFLWAWPEDMDGLAVRALALSGMEARALPPETGREAILREIRASLDAGIPALVKLGDGADWRVVAGCDGAGVLSGLDSHLHYDPGARPTLPADGYDAAGYFAIADWYPHLRRAIILGGRACPVPLPEALDGMIAALEGGDRDALEAEVMRRIGALAPENAHETALWLNDRAGYPIEARWHAAGCADSTLSRRADDPRVREKLLGVTARYVFDNDLPATHGTCWKIWAQLGVSPATGYRVPENAGETMNPGELKRLFATVFENDRIVLSLLREARAMLD